MHALMFKHSTAYIHQLLLPPFGESVQPVFPVVCAAMPVFLPLREWNSQSIYQHSTGAASKYTKDFMAVKNSFTVHFHYTGTCETVSNKFITCGNCIAFIKRSLSRVIAKYRFNSRCCTI